MPQLTWPAFLRASFLTKSSALPRATVLDLAAYVLSNLDGLAREDPVFVDIAKQCAWVPCDANVATDPLLRPRDLFDPKNPALVVLLGNAVPLSRLLLYVCM